MRGCKDGGSRIGLSDRVAFRSTRWAAGWGNIPRPLMDRSVKSVVLRPPDSANRPSAGTRHLTVETLRPLRRSGARSTSRPADSGGQRNSVRIASRPTAVAAPLRAGRLASRQGAVSFTHPQVTRLLRACQRTDAPGRGQLSAPLG